MQSGYWDFVYIYCFIIGVNSATFVLLCCMCAHFHPDPDRMCAGKNFCGCIIAFLRNLFNRKGRKGKGAKYGGP